MNELQVTTTIENKDITTWDFSVIKAELQVHLEEYKGMAYTDDTIKDAKEDQKTLNKVKKAIKDADKAYKDRCLEPYTAIQPQVKELIELVDQQSSQIKDVLDDYKARQKEEKEKIVHAYYDRKAVVLGEYADRLYGKVFEEKWTNASTGKKAYEEGILIAINKAAADLDEIRSWASPFFDALAETYIDTLSVEQVQAKDKELKESVKRAGFSEEPNVSEQMVTKTAESERAQGTDKGEGTTIRIHASKSQLDQIFDFMKMIGVTYDIL